MEQKYASMNRYFEEHTALCTARSKELFGQDRTDEATFEKIKANIYGICSSVLSAGMKTCRGDSQALQQFFMQKTKDISSNWIASHAAAQTHNDTIKMHLEQIKLDTLSEIKDHFLTLWEETP